MDASSVPEVDSDQSKEETMGSPDKIPEHILRRYLWTVLVNEDVPIAFENMGQSRATFLKNRYPSLPVFFLLVLLIKDLLVPKCN